MSFSQRIFIRLLALYPRGFREEFGPHMSQLFKDCSREALALRGTPGLITLWLATLPDLFKTAFEENFKEITHMSKEKFHRLGRWAFVLGAALIALAFVTDSMAESFGLFRGSGAWVEYVMRGIMPTALLMFLLGIASLRSAYGAAAGGMAKIWLSVSAVAALASLAASLAHSFGREDAWLWNAYAGGAVVMFLGIGLFGVVCIRRNLLPGSNWLLAIGGLALPVFAVAATVIPALLDSEGNALDFVVQVALGVTVLSLLAAGLLLQGAQESASRAVKR
jgi:hypothetical protein